VVTQPVEWIRFKIDIMGRASFNICTHNTHNTHTHTTHTHTNTHW